MGESRGVNRKTYTRMQKEIQFVDRYYCFLVIRSVQTAWWRRSPTKNNFNMLLLIGETHFRKAGAAGSE